MKNFASDYQRRKSNLPVPIVRRYRRAQHFIDEVIRQEVDDPTSSSSLTAMFAAANPDDARMDFPQLRDEILPLMNTSETMSAALCWTLYLLARHPDEEAAVVKELAQVLGDRRCGAAPLTDAARFCTKCGKTLTRGVYSRCASLY